MSVPTRRILDPIFGSPILRAANNGLAAWTKVNALGQWQKGTGWQANLYGGVQTGDDWGAVFIPVLDEKVIDFKSAMWSYYMTATQTMGVNIVIWIHDPNDLSKRAEVTQVGGASGLGKATGWNSHDFNIDTTQMFFYGEGTTGTGLTAGTQYPWTSFQTDALFKNWTIYRVSLEYGWEASGTFDYVWVVEAKLNGQVIQFIPSVAEIDTQLGVLLAAGTAAIGKVSHDKSGIGHGVMTVTTAGTDLVLAASTAAKVVIIQAQTDNTGVIAIGASGVDATVATGTGIALYAGDSVVLEIDNLADIFVDATVSGDGVRYTYLT